MENLRKAREKRGLTQQQLADLLGVSRVTYTRYETGSRSPDNETLKKLAEILNVSADYLLGIENDRSNTTIAAHSEIGYGDEIPEEARKEIENFVEYIKAKYKKK